MLIWFPPDQLRRTRYDPQAPGAQANILHIAVTTARACHPSYSTLDFREIGDFERQRADLCEQHKAVFTKFGVIRVDGDLIEEDIDRRAKLGQRRHRLFEIF